MQLEILKNGMFSKVYEVDCFQKEFKNMTKEKISLVSPFPRYQKWLIASLTVLEEMGIDALKLENFELLKNIKPNLYSIRYPKSKLNPRVLYIYLDEGEVVDYGYQRENRASGYY